MKYLLKSTLRQLVKNKLNSLVKLLGISISLLVFVLILVFVNNESSYDSHIPEADRVFRITRNWQESETYGPSTPNLLLTELRATFPEIETGTRLQHLDDKIVSIGKDIFHENQIFGVDTSFLEVFQLPLLYGDRATALQNPGSAVISLSKCKLYFGNINPIGKKLEFEGYFFDNQNKDFTVTGVYVDYPENTHFKPEILLSYSSFERSRYKERTSHSIATYIKLTEKVSPFSVEAKLPDFMLGFYGEEYYNFARTTYKLQAITDIHLNTTVYPYGYETDMGNSKSLFLFPFLGILILIIGLVNYLNLTISEGFNKGKIFGVNKLSGASKFYFFKSFLVESLVISLLSAFIIIILSPLLLPHFNKLMDRSINLNSLYSFSNISKVLLVLTFMVLINSIVPFVLFSRKKTLEFLANRWNSSGKLSPVLNLSQVIQMAICIALFIGSFVIYKQLVFIQDKTNQSMSTNNVLIIKNARYLENSRETFKQKLLDIPGANSVSLCSEIPGSGEFSNWGYPVDEYVEHTHVTVFECDHDYFRTLGIKTVEGRFFDPEFGSDENAMVLNQNAINKLGWQDNPLGKRYYLGKIFSIIGVAEDTHFESLQYQISPQAFIPNRHVTSASKVIVKLNTEGLENTMKSINSIWKEFVPNREMYLGFVDQEYEKWYKTERKTSSLSIVLSLIAIILSNLGLFASVLFKVRYKIKEIGIRKVNGARTIEILSMLNTGFVKWIIISFIVASPIAWFGMNRWLGQFAYKTEIDWWVFALSAVITMAIALITVSWQSWRAANRNPVEALRYE